MIGQKVRAIIQKVRSSWYVSVLVLLLLLPVLFVAVQTEKGWEIIAALGALLAGVAGNLVANVLQLRRDRSWEVQPGGDAYDAARGRYLQNLRAHCQALPLAALGGDEGAEHEPTLDDVYIALDTTSRVPKATPEPSQQRDMRRHWPESESDSVPLPALDAAVQATRLVLLGDPGAGKSTFVRNVLAWQARAILSHSDPPPGLTADLLPMLINLRDLAPRLAHLPIDRLAEQDRRQQLAEAVLAQVVEDLQRWQAAGFATGMTEALRSGRCVLVLDGLDEVPPQPPGLRQRVRQAVLAVLSVYHPQRLLVTCRVRSYEGDLKLPNFQAHTLAPFTNKQVEDFIQLWYRTQQKFGRVDAVQAAQRVADLTQAAQTSALRELAGNPMLLTTMALIHQRETRLPEERVCLYHLAVDILLQRWQRAKTGDAEVTTNAALAAVLKDGRRLRSLVEALAYAAHRSLQAGQAVTDIPRGDALDLLSRPAHLGDAGLADAFLNYVDERAGLLVRRGEAAEQPITYSFPHRTFQEYLAGCFLIDQRRVGRARAFFQHAGEGEFWGLAACLGAEELLYNRRQQFDMLDLAYDLCPAPEPSSTQGRRAVLWAGSMVALVGREAIIGDQGNPDGGMPYLQRLLPRLVALLGSDLTASERAEVGVVLAHLGDPRFRAEAWYLPDEPLLGFVEIPAGAFMMGSNPVDDADADPDEQPQHEVLLPRYYMARYPVTVAQFQAFVRESGHKPSHENSVRGLPNHPVVYVTWQEALAYCEWLTGALRQWPGTPEPLATLLRQDGWRVMLPSGAEWEKAARGTDGRRYPWGAEPHPNLANYHDTRLGTTSTVGCFADGTSPYGMQDMSGNVWEWTRSLWAEKYPYPATEVERAERENLQAPENAPHVLRGGAWWSPSQDVRCAFRSRRDARYIFGVGFRVIVVAGLL